MTTVMELKMRYRFESSRWGVLVTIGITFPVAVAAQQEDSVTGAELVRAACERANQALSAANPSKEEKVKAIVQMQGCGNAGVETLVTYWRQPVIDTVLLSTLAGVSASINDRRTYQAARAVLLDPSHSESIRLAALEVLLAGFDRTIAVTFPTPTKPMYTTYVGLGRNFHPPTKTAPQPVGTEARADVLSIIKQLAASDPSERMRKVAAELGPLLEHRVAR